MVKINITIDKMRQFVDLITCEGQTAEGNKQDKVIREFVITALGTHMETCAIDKEGKLLANVKMNVNVIEPGQFTVGDTNIFEKYLGVFDGKDPVTISQESGLIRIERESPKKLAKFTTVSLANIETFATADMLRKMWKFNEDKTVLGTETTKLSNLITANAEDFAQIVKDSRVVGEQHYPFVVMTNPETKQQMLKVEVGSIQTSMGVIKSIIPATIKSEDLGNKYAYGFDNVFLSLKGNVTMFTAPNLPLWIIKEEEDYSARYMLTPVID